MHADLPKSQFSGQFRWGRVSSVDAENHRVQVQFFEIDGFVSWDMQMLTTRPGDYSLPPRDTPVLCLLVDGRLGVGYVIGCFYTDDDSAPLSDDGQRSVASDDLRLGDPDAEKAVGLDGDSCDAGQLQILGGISNAFAGIQYTDPDGNVSAISASGAPLLLKAKLQASAEKVKAK